MPTTFQLRQTTTLKDISGKGVSPTLTRRVGTRSVACFAIFLVLPFISAVSFPAASQAVDATTLSKPEPESNQPKSSVFRAPRSAFPEPLELLPYRVRLLVAFDAPNLSTATRKEAVLQSRRMSDRCLGSVWRLTAQTIDWMQPVSAEGLARLQLAEIVEHAAAESELVDVWFAATVNELGSSWRVHLRAWQPDLRIESEVLSRQMVDIRDLPRILIRLCRDAFSPVGRVEDVDGKSARLVPQAGALLVPDESFSLTRTAKIFSPVMVFRNRERKTEKLQPIPWTYLTVTDASEARWECEIHSGLRNPIASKSRGRVSTMAVAVRTTAPATRLELVTQSKTPLPLIAHRIEMRDSQAFPKSDESTQHDDHLLTTLLTDRRGMVTIPTSTDIRVVWLFAYSGKHLLARVPFIPGSQIQARLDVPDDGPRLEAESDLQVLQGQLIESVAARNTLYARIRSKIKKNQLSPDQAEEKEIRALPVANVYLDRVVAIRVPAVKAAKARRDRAGEVRINRMCDEMSDLVKQYLNEDKRLQILEELRELRVENKAIAKEGLELPKK